MLQHLEMQGILPDDWWRWPPGWLNSAGTPHCLQELTAAGISSNPQILVLHNQEHYSTRTMKPTLQHVAARAMTAQCEQ
jgi:hypothetical protein